MSTPHHEPSLEVLHEGGRTLVRLRGFDGLDEWNSELFGRELSRLIDGLSRPSLVLDLRSVRYATSRALGQFVSLNRQARQAGRRFVLSNPGPTVSEILAVTRLDTVLEVDRGDAITPGAKAA
jgi:anti-anti-sigma factor